MGDFGGFVPGLDVTSWLIGKSALVCLAESPDAAEWAARIERGLVRITTVTRLVTVIQPDRARRCGPSSSGRRWRQCRWST